MKRKHWIIGLAVGLLFIVTLNIPALATQISSILEAFRSNNPEYKTVQLNSELQLLDDYKNTNASLAIDEKIEASESKIVALEQEYTASTNENEKVSIQLSIQEQQTYIYELKLQGLQYQLQANLETAYKDNSANIVSAQKLSLEYELNTKLNNYAVQKASRDYYAYLEKQKQEEVIIEFFGQPTTEKGSYLYYEQVTPKERYIKFTIANNSLFEGLQDITVVTTNPFNS